LRYYRVSFGLTSPSVGTSMLLDEKNAIIYGVGGSPMPAPAPLVRAHQVPTCPKELNHKIVMVMLLIPAGIIRTVIERGLSYVGIGNVVFALIGGALIIGTRVLVGSALGGLVRDGYLGWGRDTT
jgi:hypothetical protein